MGDRVTNSIIVKRDVAAVFQVWANFENFPYFMKNIQAVTRTSPLTSHWVMDGPLGKTIEWDAQITTFEENKRIAWSSQDMTNGNTLKTSGQVTFNPLSHGETEITVMLHYAPLAGLAGEIAAALFANPEKRLDEDLRNFKKYVEGKYERLPQQS
ncbi:MAG TPA: SRPBCC family protein [Anaerolineae bacterium]|nr:SRPBCC family protein [Anaerolineae bacterium]